MKPIISSTSIGYICIAAIFITALISCESGSSVSPEAISAHAKSCVAAGEVQYFHHTRAHIVMECKPKKD